MWKNKFNRYISFYRSKNTVNILIKNWLDVCLGALVYWASGFALTFGDSSPAFSRFIGTSYFFFHDMPGKFKNLTKMKLSRDLHLLSSQFLKSVLKY